MLRPSFVLLALATALPLSAAPLWSLGQPDGSQAEFALAPGHYQQFKEDGFAIASQPDAAKSWPCIHPGPGDGWAGGRPHTFTLCFGLTHQGAPGPGKLVLAITDVQKPIASRVRLSLNGQTVEKALEAGGGDQVLDGDNHAVHPQHIELDVPANSLREGSNQVDITTVDGCWFLYDAVTFEATGWAAAPVADAVAASLTAQPALVSREGRLYGELTADVLVVGPARRADVTVGALVAVPVDLKTGRQTISLLAPAVEQPTQTKVTWSVGGRTVAESTVTQQPVRRWEVYLLPHSHVDIGYTAVQADVERRQVDNLRAALKLIAASNDYPTGSRFKWNTEGQWAVQLFFDRATAEEKAAFEQAVRDGRLGLDALYANLLTGLCRPEELLRATRYGTDLGRRLGVPTTAAMISDVPGYTWGTVTALAQAGVHYWSIGPNYGDRIGATMSAWENKPFYWQTADGRDKVLCWVPQTGYAVGHLWGQLPPHVFGYLADLERKAYPYDVTYLRWNVGGDNGPPDAHLAEGVKAWNDRYAFPKLHIATTAEAFSAFEQRYGDRLPVVRGDWTPYWEDGAASTALETAMNRTSAERLAQAETLLALRGLPYPADAFAAAWRNVLLYSEHTWGAYNSISEPDAEFVKSQWAGKRQFALDADKQSHDLLATATDVGTGATDLRVWNSTGWAREGLITLPRTVTTAGSTPSQRLASGETAVVLQADGFGATSLASRRREQSSRPVVVTASTLDNGLLHVSLDPATGAIDSLRREGLPEALQPGGLGANAYRYLLGSDAATAQANGKPTFQTVEAGPVVGAIAITSAAPGCRKLTRIVRLVAGLDQVQIEDTIDKLPERRKEGVHLGFQFAVDHPQVRFDAPYTVIRPELDQMPGACKNWLSVGRWADVSNEQHGVTVATLDSPLLEVGGLTANLPGGVALDAWRKAIEPSATLYFWAMNNHWHTNYKADQDGPVTFRFALRPHGPFDMLAAQRFGIECSQPLLVARDVPATATAPRVRVTPDDVIVSALKPADDGRGWILRLWGGAGVNRLAHITWGPMQTKMWLSNSSEQALQATGPDVAVPAWGLVTIRIETTP